MKVAKTELFQLAELQPKAKEKAIKDWLERNQEMYTEDGSAFVKDHFKYALEQLGYPSDKIEYSLGYCQGDGMAFYGRVSGDQLPAVAARVLGRELTPVESSILTACCVDITKNHFGWHYSHHNTMDITLISDDVSLDADQSDWINQLEVAITEDVRSTSKELEADGYKTFEHYAEAYAEEDINGLGDCWFEANGKYWDGPAPDEETKEAKPTI